MSILDDKLKLIEKEKPEVVSSAIKYEPSKMSAQVVKSEQVSQETVSSIGVGNDKIIEPIPNYIQADCERVITHENLNSFIVLGRDRPSDRFSGYGGAGVKRSSAIDLVVGRSGPNPRAVDSSGEKFWVDNNFQMDAARIHISQRTNIDYNFNIRGRMAPSVQETSGIGLKADCIRLVARRDIKIVTGTDYYDSRGLTPGVDYEVPYKISLIGENRDDLIQPMVKGENLQEYLFQVSDVLHALVSTIEAFVMHQNKINQAVMNHTHLSPFWARPTTPSPQLLFNAFIPITKLVTDIKSSTMAITGMIEQNNMTYLTLPDDGDANTTNILSSYNFCN